MLVLTTMFISVSNNLPTTAYVKRINIWLIFNLLLPFILVLLHTYMDSLRTESKEADGEERTINHHGKTRTVGGEASAEGRNQIKVGPAANDERNANLVHRNEILELQVSMCLLDPTQTSFCVSFKSAYLITFTIFIFCSF